MRAALPGDSRPGHHLNLVAKAEVVANISELGDQESLPGEASATP